MVTDGKIETSPVEKRVPKEEYTVLIVDDHPIVRHGLVQLVGHEDDLVVCAEASDATQAIIAVSECKPDIALVDISLGGMNGIELTHDIMSRSPDTQVLILSMHDEVLYAERTLRAGARGYVMKQQSATSLLGAIRHVLAGNIYLSDRMASHILEGLIESSRQDRSVVGVERLSNRELEIYEMIGHGNASTDIAETLRISVKTVESHRGNIKRKLGLHTSTELVQHAVSWTDDHSFAEA